MPGKITFDEGLASTQSATTSVESSAPKRITFDEAMAANEATARPIEFTKGPFYNAATGKVEQRDNLPILQPSEELTPLAPDQPLNSDRKAIRKAVPADAARFMTALKSEIPADQKTRLRIIADDLFPGDPKGIERVGLRNGVPVYVNDQGQLQEVSSPLARGGAAVLSNAPEIGGAIIGSLGGSPAAGPAVGGMVGKLGKRVGSALFLDEPITPEGVGKEVAIEGAINYGAGKVAQGVGAVLNRGKFIQPGALDSQSIRDAERLIRRIKQSTGVELDMAQATGNRYLLELRDFVAKNPGKSSDIFQIRDAAAAGQFDTVANKVLDLVAQPVPAGIAGARAQNVAEGVITAARKDVQAAVQPKYDAAYQSVPQITDTRLLDYLKLPYFQRAFASGQRIARLEGTSLQAGQPPDLRSFDYLKQGLDDVIKKLESKGSRKEAFALRERKKEFVQQLDANSGNLYKDAREAYEQGIKQNVEPLENGLVGLLARMSPQNAEKAGKILKGSDVSPESIGLLQRSLSRLDPDAYKGLVRQYLTQEYDRAVTSTQGSEVINPAGKFYQELFGSPRKREKLEALLPPGALPLAKDLFEVAEKLAKTPLGANRIAGSQTASKQQLAESLGNRFSIVQSLLSGVRESAREGFKQENLESGIEMITRALTDPKQIKLLQKAVRIKDSTRQRIALGFIFSGQTSEELLKDLGENVEPASRE